jgi:type IV fimbrial biogenesis protein FimT
VLIRATLSRGFTLIEIAITLAVIGVVLALGAPSFAAWIQNTQIRSATESMLTGMKLARVEALKSNCTAHFQLTDSSGTLSASGTNWITSSDARMEGTAVICDPSEPQLIRSKPSAEGTPNTAYSASTADIGFDALGRVIPAGDVTVDITNPTGGACAPSGPMRCLRILLTAGGQARMCDPAVTGFPTDPRTC